MRFFMSEEEKLYLIKSERRVYEKQKLEIDFSRGSIDFFYVCRSSGGKKVPGVGDTG